MEAFDKMIQSGIFIVFPDKRPGTKKDSFLGTEATIPSHRLHQYLFDLLKNHGN